MQFQSSCLQELQERGFIHQCTNYVNLDQKMAAGSIRAYVGFDPTAKSLHVGNLVSIMMLRIFQRHGHQPIIIVGGATGKIGDPTGKDEMRRVMTDEEREANVQSILSIYGTFVSFGDKPSGAFTLNNDDWFRDIKYLDFLRDYGHHFTINRMLTFDSVKTRLEREQPLTFLEFNYMLLQAYDFAYLNKKYNCDLQMGGSDQWGNIVNGVELIRRVNGKEAFGLTSPLVTTANGEKMGKSAGNAVWLKREMLPDYDYWQFWRNVDDVDVGRFLRMFTDLPLADIAELEKLEGAELNKAKVVLADEATKLARGAESLPAIHETVKSLFAERDTGYTIDGYSEDGSPNVTTSLPVVKISGQDFPISVVDLFVKADLETSKGAARRAIQGGALKINDTKVTDINEEIVIPSERVLKLSSGKKRHTIIIIQN